MSKPEVLPCPFCDSPASLKHVLAGPRVTCSGCRACGPTTYMPDAITDADFQAGDVQAINAWNASAADKARIEELTEALAECAASLAWNCFGECRAVHDGPIMPAAGALDMARAALAQQGKEG